MDIIKQNNDEGGALLRVQIVKNDYDEAVKKSLNTHRRKAEIRGFRPGMAPMSLIQKLYGRSVLLEEINKLISESLGKYIEDEKLDIIGEPIPCDDEQQDIDWDNQSDFEFVYEIGYAPKYELKIDKTIQIPFYHITINEDDINERVDALCQNCGKLEDTETVNENDIIKVDINQDGENTIKVEDAMIAMRSLKSQEQKAHFLNLKTGDTVTIDINELYTQDEEKIKLLKIKKEALETINPKFNFTVKSIKTYKKSNVNQELFDAVYGKDTVKSEEEFLQRVKEGLTKSHEEDSNYKFSIDVRKELIAKAELKFPEAFLKKWLLIINENKLTAEQIDKDFEPFIADLSWQTIRNNIARENDIKIEDADIKDIAMENTRKQLMQYGLTNLPDEDVERFSQHILNDKQQYNKMVEQSIDDKVFEYLKTAVQLDEKSVTVGDFYKMFA
ncbi:MAG: trigger factor [Prevotellaceae bacterium]|jgi:trigger factor|nr:trigger factor [Prevotellaceae bacterium]